MVALYVGTIIAANWLIARFGVVPVGFGLTAPAGVYAAGLAFMCRDLVQDTLGRAACIVAILAGATLSFTVSGHFAVASGIAFLIGELADFAVYTPMRRRWWLVAMLVANPVGDLVDSLIFLAIAFGNFHFWQGQFVGKEYMTLVSVLVLWLIRHRTRWLSTVPRYA